MRGQASKERDTETGLHYYGAKYYDSKLGIWLSEDPLLDDYPGLSPYNYCMNNPLVHVDPDGRNPFVITEGAKALFVATVVLTVATLHTAKYATDRSYRESVNKTGQSVRTVLKNTISKIENAILHSESGTETTGAKNKGGKSNTNPYPNTGGGVVTEPVTVVDPQGNAIPVNEGEQIHDNPEGTVQEVKDSDGKPTGNRLDGKGHPQRKDPKAQKPHAHRNVNGQTVTQDGNPHLPIKEP